MSHEQDGYHSVIRGQKQRWDDEDAARDKPERRAKEIFLEEHASQIFAPIEHYLTRLDKVIHSVGASVEINTVWEHLGDQRLGGCTHKSPSQVRFRANRTLSRHGRMTESDRYC
jgi:hypothetical protein